MQRPSIDWRWVRKELFRMERISPSKKVIASRARDCLRLAKKLVKPKMISTIKNASGFMPSSLSSHMKGAREMVYFLVTLGGALEKRSSLSMAKGDELEGYLLDRIGSIAVEALAEAAETSMREFFAKKGKSLSMRFSPGYCDWPIEEQFKVAKILDFSKAGVKLNDKCMMVPKKTISAACAIGPKGLFSRNGTPCTICTLKECAFRRKQ